MARILRTDWITEFMTISENEIVMELVQTLDLEEGLGLYPREILPWNAVVDIEFFGVYNIETMKFEGIFINAEKSHSFDKLGDFFGDIKNAILDALENSGSFITVSESEMIEAERTFKEAVMASEDVPMEYKTFDEFCMDLKNTTLN